MTTSDPLPRIRSARITAKPRRFADPIPQVYVTLDDGNELFLFDYYADEISFAEAELVGLTVEEALELKRRKDAEFLRS